MVLVVAALASGSAHAGVAVGVTPLPAAVPLWPAGAPGSEGRKNLPESTVDGNIAGIHNPSLTPFLPEVGHATGAAVVIIPGGGHRFVVVEKEGYTVARWLAAHGVAAFVLKYRLAREPGSTYQIEVESLHDVQRAVRLVRSRASAWAVDPTRVGVLGFSAGGQLAALAAMRFDAGQPHAPDPVERESARPAFQGLVYPGATETIVPTKESPPVFLVAGNDDRADISEGIARAYLAFHAAGVPAELHVYTGVGHGFALRAGPATGWITRFTEWIAERTGPPPGPSPALTVRPAPPPPPAARP